MVTKWIKTFIPYPTVVMCPLTWWLIADLIGQFVFDRFGAARHGTLDPIGTATDAIEGFGYFVGILIGGRCR